MSDLFTPIKTTKKQPPHNPKQQNSSRITTPPADFHSLPKPTKINTSKQETPTKHCQLSLHIPHKNHLDQQNNHKLTKKPNDQ